MKKIYIICLVFTILLSIITVFGQVTANNSFSYTNRFSETDSDCNWDIPPDFYNFKNGQIRIHGIVFGYNTTDNDASYVHPLKRASISIRSVDANSDNVWIDKIDIPGVISIPDLNVNIDVPFSSDDTLIDINSDSLNKMLSDFIKINFSSDYNQKSISSGSDDDYSLFEEIHVNMNPCSEIGSIVNYSWTKKVHLWRYAFTDKNGEFSFDFLQPGTYEITASKMGYESFTKTITIDEGSAELDFILKATEISYIFNEMLSSENLSFENISNHLKLKMQIDDAIINGYVGCKIVVNTSIGSSVFIYSDGLIINATNITDNKISFKIRGDDDLSGKTIIIDVQGDHFYDFENLIIEYDGEEIRMADDLEDVLNPHDDGLHAEYWVIYDANGQHILISIPHFSEHQITVYSVNLAESSFVYEVTKDITTMIALYAMICIVASVLFVGIINLRKKVR